MHRAATPSSSTTPSFPAFLNLSIFSSPHPKSSSSSRPTTREGGDPLLAPAPPTGFTKQSLSPSARKISFSAASPFRRSSATSPAALSFASFVTDSSVPPALPDYALPTAAKVQQVLVTSPQMNMPSRTLTTTTTNTSTPPAAPAFMPPPTPLALNGGGASSSVTSAAAVAVASSSSSSIWQPSEATMIHQQITELATKRISTLDYLRKAYVRAALSVPYCRLTNHG